MTQLLPLRELIEQKPRPETTLSLLRAVRDVPEESVASYVFTDTIRSHFLRILEAAATGHGQGFWVQAEYGAGKTHFLAALASLLANRTGDLWSQVQDEEVRSYERRLQNTRLFPVIVSLRGMGGGGDDLSDRNLLDVVLNDGVQPALSDAGLAERVRVTAADDYVAWLAQTAPAIRADVDAYVRSRTGKSVAEYRDGEGKIAAAQVIADYCKQHAINPHIAAGVKERLAHIYRQLLQTQGSGETGQYNGLLVIIDEYEGWEKSNPNPAARAQDEDVLETLAYLLPRDLGYRVFTVVASQSAAPAKLRGGAGGDRFISLALLANTNERDYDVIVSRRVRGLSAFRLPEVDEYHQYCRRHFEFAANLNVNEFRDVFPFQPRCFEVVRHITARELPTARSGITVFHEVVNEPALLERNLLIRVADLLQSPHLAVDCMSAPIYQPAFRAYKVARKALPTLDMEAQDLALAQDILDTLFLWHLAYLERPRSMAFKELAQATLTTSDFLRAEDSVAYTLSLLQPLAQIRVEGQQASFVATGEGGQAPSTLFAEYRRRALADTYGLRAAWSNSLQLTTAETRGAPGMFASYKPEEPKGFKVEVRNLTYSGEVVLAPRWRFELGQSLPKEDIHFRVVMLTPEAADEVTPEQLQDGRIAVVVPAPLSEEAKKAAADWLAWNTMNKDYGPEQRSGREADAIREWLSGQRSAFVGNLVGTHLRVYQAGRIVTRDGLAIGGAELSSPNEDRRLAAVVTPLLMAAYPQTPIDLARLRNPLRAAEVVRIFAGYFGRQPATADRAALRNFGVVLGLSSSEHPERFAPQQAPALTLIAAMLRERNGELPVWRIVERLSLPPYGLPYPLILLFILAFVRQGDPRTELTLKRGHRLRTADRTPFPAAKVTAAAVTELEFKPGLEKDFDMLVLAAGPAWNDVVPYGREIVADLRSTTDPADVEVQNRRLAEALQQLAAELGQTRQNLVVLQQNLGGRLPERALDALDGLATIASAGDSYDAFYMAVGERYASAGALRDDRAAAARLKELAGHAAAVAALRHYLEDVRLRPGDTELAADKAALLGQLRLESLAEQPQLWASIAAQAEQFRSRYRTAYQKHHRDYQARLQQLQEMLVDAPRRLEVLALLNGIEELGRPLGERLHAHYRALAAQSAPCSQPFANLTLDGEPVCPTCRLAFDQEVPQGEVEQFARELERGLRDQQRRLASEAIRRVLARGDGGGVATFVQAVQAANVAPLVDVMDDEMAGLVRRLLAEENVVAVRGDRVLVKLIESYPTLEEQDLDRAVAAFRQLLQDAFRDAHKANPEKKSVRLTLK